MQDDRNTPTPLEDSILRAYKARDIPRFCRLIGKLLSVKKNRDGGDGFYMFNSALAAIQKKEDDRYNSIMNKGDSRHE